MTTLKIFDWNISKRVVGVEIKHLQHSKRQLNVWQLHTITTVNYQKFIQYSAEIVIEMWPQL